jgi:hypothetical protein
MTTSYETVNDTARHSQEALAHAVQDWADSVQKFVGPAPTLHAKVARANEVVDKYFNVAAQMVASQREFTKSILALTTSAATKAMHEAEGVAKNTQEVVKEMGPKKS